MNLHSKVYVAGHTGLVGSAIIRKLKENNYTNMITVDYLKLDLRNQLAVDEFFEKEKPEYIILAAAKVGGILSNSTYKAEFIYDNLMIACNVIHASYKYGVKKLLNLGSSCIYPKNAPQPLKEEYLLSDYLESTNEPYAMAKISAIKLCRYYNEQYKTNFISVMPTNLYGPNDNFNLETSHVLPALIRKFHLAKLLAKNDYVGIINDFERHLIGFGLDNKVNLNKRDILLMVLNKLGITKDNISLWGTGRPYREFLYVDDLANCLLFLLKNYDYEHIGEFVNIGTGKDIEIVGLANIIRNIVGFEGEIKFNKSKLDGTSRKLLDVSKIKNLGWQHKIELEVGIKKLYDWYLKKDIGNTKGLNKCLTVNQY